MRTPHLRIRLLGELDLRHDGVPVPPFGSARAESLLAYLVLHREAAQPRQRLAFLLWPDSSESQARTNLRHLLHVLRRALPGSDRFLEATPRTLRWRDDAPSWVDVAAFEAAATRAERAAEPGEELAALGEAAELYTGDLLQGVYDDWVLGERERLRQRHLQVLERLLEVLEARGETAAAISHAERLLRDDPLREATWQVLMRLHDARGDRARALRTYHACAATLERELGVEPSAATRRAYEALLPSGPDLAGGEPPDRLGPVGAPPLVGRAAQRASLADLWRSSSRGAARLVLVTGEPGAGKTRLVEELRSWCVQQGAAAAEARSYPAEGALAYGPVVSWLRSPPLADHLGRLDPPLLAELARLLPELRQPGPPRPDPPPGRDQRRLLFEAIAQAVTAPGRPLLLVADDLHWADTETVALLHYLLRSRPRDPLLVAATARDEDLGDQHPLHELRTGLAALGQLAEIGLGRLSPQETAALGGRLAGHELAPPEAERLFAETEGNPLFVVEVLRAGWHGGPGERGPVTPWVQSVIESRLARLSGPARDLLGVAATIGREFTTDVLAQAGRAGEDELVGALDELWRRRIVRDQGPDAYDFTHDRIREVAYLALSPARRRHTHRRVARALERLHAGDPGPVAAQLAVHHERAGDAEEAVAWYQEAAAAAQRLPAYAEAVRLLERALALLEARAPGPARRERELAVLTRLQGPLGVVAGYGSERLAEVQRRGLALADELGEEPAAPLLRSLAMAALARGDVEEARRLGERLRAGGAGPAGPDGQRALQGHYVLGIVAFWHGEFETARHHLEAALDRAHAESRPGRGPGTTEVLAASRLANTLGFLGRPEAAARARDRALKLATRTGHPHSRVGALMFAAMLALELRDPVSVRAYAAELAARPGDLGRPTGVVADALAGYVEVLDGHPGAGIARIRRALEGPAEGEHAPGMHAMVARVLLEAGLTAGDAETALAAADRVIGDEDNVRTWESEGRRRQAELRAALGAAPDVEAGLREALAVARRQGARLFERRAAAGLLRRYLDAGDGPAADEARARLAALVAGLPEGGDLPDLREAAALLGRG